MSTRASKAVLLGAVALCGLIGSAAAAAPVATKDADDFDFFWGFDLTSPSLDANLDLYNNTTGAAGADGTGDFSFTTATSGISIASGALVANVSLVSPQNNVWKTAPSITGTGGFTFEYRVRIDSITGTSGLVVYASAENDPIGGIAFSLGTDNGQEVVNLHWALSIASASTIKATVPKADFFTVRVVSQFDSGASAYTYTLYVNDALVEDGLAPSHSSTTTDLLLLGRASGSHQGVLSFDYVAFTPGVFAPVPEPAALGMAALGGVLMLAGRSGQSRASRRLSR